MKNLHLLPTYKPSRLSILNSGKLNFGAEIISSSNSKPQHIYITSDEEIKEGDGSWILDLRSNRKAKNINNHIKVWNENCKKITLTTDQDLIKDGVQAIDDEFLEWFVKNPSCEEVEVGYGWIRLTETDNEGYWVSIPDKQFEMQQEEPKQETLEEVAERLHPVCIKPILDKYDDRVTNVISEEDVNEDCRESFIEGAKWQQERMYSEEDLKKAYFSAIEITGEGWNGEYAQGNNPNIEETFQEEFNQWFEQFKKK
jgi:hypothetical protein